MAFPQDPDSFAASYRGSKGGRESVGQARSCSVLACLAGKTDILYKGGRIYYSLHYSSYRAVRCTGSAYVILFIIGISAPLQCIRGA